MQHLQMWKTNKLTSFTVTQTGESVCLDEKAKSNFLKAEVSFS